MQKQAVSLTPVAMHKTMPGYQHDLAMTSTAFCVHAEHGAGEALKVLRPASAAGSQPDFSRASPADQFSPIRDPTASPQVCQKAKAVHVMLTA